jgi:hypothetical protein
MGRKITIIFLDVPSSLDSFGLTMSGASASFEINADWGTTIDPGWAGGKEASTTNLYNYINSNLPVGTDITVSKTTDTIYLFSESATNARFYQSGTGDLIISGAMGSYANVSAQSWSSNYSVGSNILNLSWSGASDPEGFIKGYDLNYKVGNSSTWITVPLINTVEGAASYDFTIGQQVTHVFRVRTVDTSNLTSDYIYFTYSITPIFQISPSSVPASSACSILAAPNTPVYLQTATPSINGYVYTNSLYSTGFDGTRSTVTGVAGSSARNWKIATPTNALYSCTINGLGLITAEPILCSSPYSIGLLSNKATTGLKACNYNVLSTNPVYWQGSLVVGRILYRSVTGVTLTTPVTQGHYRILYTDPTSGLDSDYIIEVSSTGAILSINVYSSYCAFSAGGGGSGGGGGGGCVDPLVSILLPNGSTKIAAEIKVNDIILTIHEITKELGEFKVLNKKIITQPKVIVKFTDGTEIKVSDTHKFLMSDNTWKQIFMLKGNETVKGLENDKTIEEIIKIGEGDVVMFEIEEAHTYISDGLISHNKGEYLSLSYDDYSSGNYPL